MKVNKIGKKKSRDFDSSILLSPAGIFSTLWLTALLVVFVLQSKTF